MYLLHNPILRDNLGGTELHVEELVQGLQDRFDVIVVAPDGDALVIEEFIPGRRSRRVSLGRRLYALMLDDADLREVIRQLLFEYRVDLVHFQHFLNLCPSLVQVCKEAGIPTVVSAHDFYALCPSYNLLRADGGYCGVPQDRTACDSCLAVLFRTTMGIAAWREPFQKALQAADRVVFPSESLRGPHCAVHGLDSAKTIVIPHGLRLPAASGPEPPAAGSILRQVVFYGNAALPHKGQSLISALVPELVSRGLAVRFVGTASDQWPAFGLGEAVTFTGPYARHTGVDELRRAPDSVVCLLSSCPESYSLTLSEAWAAGRPVVVSPFGALRERVEKSGGGLVASTYTVASVLECIDELRRSPETYRRISQQAGAVRPTPVEEMTETYAELYTRLLKDHSRGGDNRPTASIIIPTYNKWEYTARCLTKLTENTRGFPVEVIIVDNASTDGTRDSLRQLSEVCTVILNDTNLGFAKACNQGARAARGKYLVFLNNDTEPQPGWLEAMVKVVESDSSVAIVGSKLLFPDGTIQHGGVAFVYAAPAPISPVHLDYRRPAAEAGNDCRELKAVTAACMLIRPEAFGEAGGFDEQYVNGYEDVDLCLKVWSSGRRIIYTPESVLVHHESVSDGRFLKASENIELLHRRWMGRFTAFDFNAFAGASSSPTDQARPGVSVVVVTHDSLQTVAPCLESLALHTGPQDEIILVDNASKDETPRFVQEFAKAHPGRLKVVMLRQNEGQARGLNRGLAETTREYVALITPDVQVAEGWLDRLLSRLTADPVVAAVGPVLNLAGEQDLAPSDYEAGLKGPETLAVRLAERGAGQVREVHHLRGNCLLCRREDLRQLGDLDPELYVGLYNLDLSWRWRQAGRKLLVAADVFVRHWSRVSLTQQALLARKHLAQQSANAWYERLYWSGGGRVPSLKDLWGGETPRVVPQTGLTSLVVLVRDNLEVTRQCIESVYDYTHRDFELIVVDNGSGPEVGEWAAELQKRRGNVVYVRNDQNEGYAFGVNQGLAVTRGEYVVLLNNDVVVTPGWLSRQLALLALDPKMGLVGPRTNCSAGFQQVDQVPYEDLAGFHRFAAEWAVDHAGQFVITTRITGVCMALRREVLEKVGGFDTAFGVGNFEDDDFCLRVVRAGYLIGVAQDAFVHHYGSTTFKALAVDYGRLMAENWRFFCEKWDHHGEMREGYPALTLAQARPFDPERDYVPTDCAEVFNPAVPPLALGEARPVCLLCLPDWENPAWQGVVTAYLRTFAAADPVSLVIRVEPPLPELVEEAQRKVEGLLRKLGLAECATPDLILETSPLPTRRRGSLYTAADALLACGGNRAGLYAREARACGLPVLAEPTPEALRKFTA